MESTEQTKADRFIERIEQFNKDCEPYDHLKGYYFLTVSVARTYALLITQSGIESNDDSLKKLGAQLLGKIASNHPDLFPIIKKLLEDLILIQEGL